MGIFSVFKKKKVAKTDLIKETVSLINFEELKDANDIYLTKLATEIIIGNPLIANLEQLDIDSANKVVAFLSGVIYAIDGEILNIKEKVFLFGNHEVYNDGTVKKLLEEIS